MIGLLDCQKFVLNERRLITYVNYVTSCVYKLRNILLILIKMTKKITKIGSIGIPVELQEAADKAGKTENLSFFLSSIPTIVSKDLTSIFERAAKDPRKIAIKTFIDALHSFDSVEKASAEMPKYYSYGIGAEIMDINRSGVGRGEVLVSWLVKNSEIQGGSKNFDIFITVGNKNYEVKDYRGPKTKPIRLAVKSQVAWYPVQYEINKTIRLLEKLQMIAGGTRKFSFEEHFKDQEFIDSANKILNRKVDIRKGSFGIKDKKNFEVFYSKVANIEHIDNQYTVIELRGSGTKPQILSIAAVLPEQVDRGSFNVQVVSSKESEANIIVTNLRRIGYARNSESFSNDMQNAVNNAIKGTQTIVFRNSGVSVSPENNAGPFFVYHSTTQGRMVIIEDSLIGKAEETSE